MSVYGVNSVGRAVLHDHTFRARLGEDPLAALASYDLTEEEHAALLAGDVGTLYRLGAHEYLLMNLARFGSLGLDPRTFSARMRVASRGAEAKGVL